MSISLTEEHRALSASVRRFLESPRGSADAREPLSGRPDVWSRLATELDITGLGIDPCHGGSGSGFLAQAIVIEELGRLLAGSSYLSSAVLVPQLIGRAADEAVAAALLPDIAAGRRRAALAYDHAKGPADPAAGMRAERVADGFRLTGSTPYVLDGCTADALLVVAHADRGPTLFSVDVAGPGVRRERLDTLDLTRELGAVHLEGACGVLIGALGGAEGPVTWATDVATVALAVEQVGGTQRCLDMSVAYAKVRTQFGRRIGSFQAVKHKAADMLVAVESARSAAYAAVWAVDNAPGELPLAASLAKAVCSDAFVFVSTENIQIHGGVGFTWEHDAHLYYRRAHSSALMFGDSRAHRERIAVAIGC
jgi:alkylation response protein AidB-like acyl-CoA dehydrogenase